MPNLKNKKVIKDQQGQRKYPGRVTKIQGNTMATTGYGDIPLYVVPNVGNPMVVPANSGNRVFPGASSFTEYPIAKNSGWLDDYQVGGKVSPYKPATINEYNFRNKMYSDSLALAKQSRKLNWIWPENPNITKEEHDKLRELEDSYPQYNFSQEQYDIDKKKKNVGNFKDYIQQWTFGDEDTKTKSITGKDLSEGIDLYEKSKKQAENKYSKEWVDKKGLEYKFTPDGYDDYSGFLSTYDPQSGTTVDKFVYKDHPEDNRTLDLYNKYIKPTETLYKGNKNKKIRSEVSFSSSSTGWYDSTKPKPKFKNTSNDRYIGYDHQTEDKELYPFPKQKILKPDKNAPKGEDITMELFLKNKEKNKKQENKEPKTQAINIPNPIDEDRREVNFGQKYQTFNYPGKHGYSGNDVTSKYFNPTTKNEININKSFNSKGDYSPVYFNGSENVVLEQKKYGGWLDTYEDGGETDPPGGLKNNQWMGANLNKEGYITSETKGGNRITFTSDQKADDFFNKQIDSGKWGFDPKTGGTFLLKKPVKGLSKEDQFIATKEYHDLRAPKGFTNESQKQQIAKLPKFQQDIINAENEKRRKKVVSDSMQEVGKHPLFYAPGIIGAAPFAVAGLSEAGMASAPYIQGALSTQLPGMANVSGATVGNAIGSAFIGHGAAHITPDAIEMYKNPSWSNAGNLAMDVAEVSPIIGPTSKVIGKGLNTAGKYLTEETALKNAYKLNPLANKEVPLNKLYHKTNNPNLSLDEIDLLRLGKSQSKKRHLSMLESERPSGFYTSDEAFYPFMGGKSKFSFDFPANAKIKDLKLEGRITDRISQNELKELQKEGYDLIRGENMIGQTEYIPLNKSKISNWNFEGTAGESNVIPGAADQSVFDHLKKLKDQRFETVNSHWLKGYPKVTKELPGSSNKIKSEIEETALNNSFFVNNVNKNLIDLQEAKKFAQQYGYELPKNLERISQSNELTNRTIRGMMDRHNTFVRGVSTNWDEIAKKNPEILRHLENKGIDWQNNPKAAAEYMSTHIPINTGYGRASLNNEVFDRGLEGLYTSNSFPTAEGYTYGKGFVVKAKKPTDFSSPNRKDWITKNNPHYRDEDKFRELAFPLSDEANYAITSSKSKSWRPKIEDEKLLKNATSKQKAIKQIEYRIEELKKNISEIEPNKDKFIDSHEVLSSKKETIKQLENDVKYLHQHGDEILKVPGEFNLLRTEREAELDIKNGFKFNEKLKEFLKSKGKDIHSSNPASEEGEILYQQILNQEAKYRNAVEDGLTNKVQSEFIYDFLINKYPEFSDFSNSNKYAHYIHLGTPGKKVLEPIKSWEITPEIWKNKSRAHTNKYSKKFSALKYGGWLEQYAGGGETDPPVNLRSASTQLSSPVSTQAPEVPLNKTGWDWVKQKYENRQPSEWNMLMMDKSGSYVDSGVDPFSLMLTAPQQVIKAGVKGAKALLDASKSNKIKPSTLQNVENVQKSGIINPLKIADNIIPRTFAPGTYIGIEDSWNNYSPLNLIPGYGKKLSQNSELYSPNIMFNDKPALLDNITSAQHPVGFRKFGNSIQDVIDRKVLGPRGKGFGSEQIIKEGNWSEASKVNENYPGLFEATMNPNVKGSNIKLEKWHNRNGIVGTTKEGNVDIPLTDPGLSFNRRLPFSNKYVSIDKQKLIDNKFQLATQLPHVQSLIEKYGIIAGQAAVFGYLYGGKDQAIKNLKTVNKYSIDPVANWTKKQWEDLKKSDFYKESTKALQNKQDNSQWLNKYK